MNLKSYLHDRAPNFAESEIAPIHLFDVNGRHYYAFIMPLQRISLRHQVVRP